MAAHSGPLYGSRACSGQASSVLARGYLSHEPLLEQEDYGHRANYASFSNQQVPPEGPSLQLLYDDLQERELYWGWACSAISIYSRTKA